MAGMDALLLGRRTYDIFAGYWPQVADRASGPGTGDSDSDSDSDSDLSIARLFNRIPKYVASRQARTLDWTGSTQLGPDVPAAIRELRDRHANIHVIGSLDLVQTLLAERLFDRLTLWVYPILLGAGKKVFAGGAVPTNLRLIEPVVTSPKGAVLQRYALEDGTPAVGDMAAGPQNG